MGGSKRKKGDNGGEEGKQMITDSRFSKAHTDPRFRSLPRRESKVTIDSRFKGVLTDKASAPVDKRGKRRRRGSAKDSLKEYYRIDEEDEEKNKKKKQKRKEEDESGGDDESEGEEALMALEAEARRRKSEQVSEDEEEEEESKIPLKLAASSDEESDENADSEDNEDVSEEAEEDTDEDDDAMYDDDGPEVAEEEVASIEKETHRLAIVNMDWRYVSAKDLYVVLNSFLPKDGRLLSVAVYPSEFGLERMKQEEIHGPAIGGDKKNEDNSDDEDEDEDEDEDVINERLRDYEKSRLRYYFAVAECDSSATADHLYKQCDGIEFERSSNKLDLRFIPDSMQFKHPPRDTATEAPATYQGVDFHSQALQMSRVDVSWDEDEPHRVRTLKQGFNPDQLADLELKEFLASDESESDDSGDDDEEKRKEKYLTLMESGDVDSDKDEDEENDQDMVVEFNTGLEDLSNKFREKKEEKPETVWEAQLRKMREKKKARRMQKKDDGSSDDDSEDDDDYNVDHKKKKKMMNKKKGLEEKLAADEKSLAELELIVADENGKGLKGYNIKGKGKKRSKEMAEDKIPSADPDDQRFSVAFTDPNYALDPTNPQFKRSATYVKQLTQKQKQDPRSQEEQVKDVETKTTDDGTVGPSKKRSFAESATVKSMKLKMQQKGSEKKKEGTAELAQRVKNKAKALSKK
ncbi:pre-rRNA-processing protein ESF1 [Raphanus sativus]|uniref:Pre-rRNA-processing protein ESF1 n=1 Tax=Raphanus sativus TaxID=3726 RepID=A0A6J0NVK3_RAPSA|nr:pre-rRNA-processing protein ESF1 [Raphanus sativus]